LGDPWSEPRPEPFEIVAVGKPYNEEPFGGRLLVEPVLAAVRRANEGFAMPTMN
jgi:hypothetical protein